jgi:hypothetical protein
MKRARTEAVDDSEEVEHPFKRLADDLAILVRKEFELARAEIADKVRTAGIGAGLLGGSAITAALALASLTIFAILALSLVLAPWIAAGIVTAVWCAVTVVLAFAGQNKMKDAGSLLPEQTIQNVRDDVNWAKQQVLSGKK